ncbi:MAG: pseudouridine synthase [Solirubrobacterales bacterium]
MRLAKYLAHAGVASRRASEKLIANGRVSVGGHVVRDPARDVDNTSQVAVDGDPISPEARETWMVHKPVGVTSTAHEPGERTAVVELVDSLARLYPVGRLDVDSTGLILLTNEGELTNRLTHPRYEVPRTYIAHLRRPPTDKALQKLRNGVQLDDGPTLPADVRRSDDRIVEITLREGRNRQVRRMAEAIDNRVVALQRIAFGSLRLGRMAVGQGRRLRPDEMRALWEDANAMQAQGSNE